MTASLYEVALAVFLRLPVRLRRRVFRSLVPTWQVGAAAAVVADGRLLLVRHRYRDRWGLPGGVTNRSEDPADTAVRETREETGVPVVLRGEAVSGAAARWQRLDVAYAAVLAPGARPEDAHVASPEIAEVRWWPLDGLPPLQPEAATLLVLLSRVRSSGEGPQAG
jgi:ADP-ribose pyrophosphatase YjhB (NUDIX family)